MATHTIGGRRSVVGPIRLLFGVFLILHGIAHFVGATESLAAIDDGTSVSYLWGAWKIADPTALRLLAGLWVVVGIAVLASGVAVLIPLARWRMFVAAAATASLVMSVLAMPAAVVGVVIDVLVLLALAFRDRVRLGDATAERGVR